MGLFLAGAVAHAQQPCFDVSTFAGRGVGDGGPATAAVLVTPRQVVAWPFPQDDETVRPKMTKRIESLPRRRARWRPFSHDGPGRPGGPMRTAARLAVLRSGEACRAQ